MPPLRLRAPGPDTAGRGHVVIGAFTEHGELSSYTLGESVWRRGPDPSPIDARRTPVSDAAPDLHVRPGWEGGGEGEGRGAGGRGARGGTARDGKEEEREREEEQEEEERGEDSQAMHHPRPSLGAR